MEHSITTVSSVRRNIQAYVLFAACVAMVVMLGIPLQILNGTWGLAATELLFILLPVVIFVMCKRLPLRRALRWKAVSPVTALLCLATGVGTWGIVAGTNEIIVWLLGKASPVDLPPFAWKDWLVLIVVAAVLPAICEEALFRGAVQGTLERVGVWRASVITAMLFALFHLNPLAIIPLFIMGLAFSIVCWRTGSSVSSMLAHLANNAVGVTAPRVFLGDAENNNVWVMLGCATLALIVFPIFWIHTRKLSVTTPLLATVPASMTRRGLIVTALVGVTSFTVWIGAAIVAGVYLLLFIEMPDNTMAHAIESNDRLVVLSNEHLPLKLQPDDYVAVQIGEALTVRQVTEIDGGSIRVTDNRGQASNISLSQVKGKLIHNFKRSSKNTRSDSG